MDDPSEQLMALLGPCDLVQDVTTDCSVVASLCAAMKILVSGANNRPVSTAYAIQVLCARETNETSFWLL